MVITEMGRLLGLTPSQCAMLEEVNEHCQNSMDPFIPRTGRLQRIAKSLVDLGFLTVDHTSDDGQHIAVKFTNDNANAMVDYANS